MNREVSIALDLTRILAAGAVFLSHAAWHDHTGGLFWQITGIGQEAVDVFFVLSGFVIAHVTATREIRAGDYALNRAARVLSVALPALLATFLLDAVGRAVSPGLYREWCCDNAGPVVWQFVRNAAFLGDVWSWHVAPGSDIPWWSLGYEVFYYFAYGLFLFVPKPWNGAAAAAVMLAGGPGIAILFPLWLLGVVGYRCRPVGRVAAWWMLLGGVVLLPLASAFAQRQGQIYDPFALTAGRLGDYAQDYLIGLLFLGIVLGVRGVSAELAGVLGRIAGPVRWLAGATFALYLFHLPLMRAVVAVSPWPAEAWGTRGLVLVGVPLAVLLLAEVTERKKTFWRNGLVRVFTGWRARVVE